MANENLGPAERIIASLLAYSDHMVHNRPGVVSPDPHAVVGVKWQFAKRKVEKKADGSEETVVYALSRVGKRNVKTRLGTIDADGKTVKNGAVRVGEFRKPGFFPEVAAWMYKQVAEVWKLDNEFAARWASYAFGQEHKDLKVVLCAFMLVQSRCGEPIMNGDKCEFLDDDFREIGEAMILLQRNDGKDFNPKLLWYVRRVLTLPGVMAINHELGFGKSARRAPLTRWEKAVTAWFQYRERNPKLLKGLVKAGFRQMVISLAQQVGYKPETPEFFQTLRWEQEQAKTGHRTLAIGEKVAAGETWEGLTEMEVCERIAKDKPKWNRLSVMIPKGMGLTRAIMAAAVETGCVSKRELIILSPTLEELGLLQVQAIRDKWEKAQREADDMRAANIAKRMKSKEAEEKLQETADVAVQKAVAEVVKGLFIYVLIDKSGSMRESIPVAVRYISQFLQGFPLEKLVVVVFDTQGRTVQIKHPSKAGVENAFKGIEASGGTDHGSGIREIAKNPRKPAPDEDAIFIFIGDEGERKTFDSAIRVANLNPMAFGLLRLPGENYNAVTNTATALGVPCFMIDERIFADPYAIPRTLRALVAATPVGRAPVQQAAPRVTLVDTILKTELLKKPAWAVVAAA